MIYSDISLLRLLVTVVLFIISTLPLHFAVRFMGGKTNILKTAFISFLIGLIVGAIQYAFNFYGGLIAFFVTIWIYHESFRLKWWKSLFAWLLQFVFIALFYFLAVVLLGAVLGIALLPAFL